jgi:hypothetical protein
MSPSRLLLVALTLWGLAMIVPDLLRIVQPLGSLGFYANNDGLVYDVDGPFPDEAASPGWRAGIRVGDQVDLKRMRCTPGDHARCGDALAVLGGVEYVLPDQSVTVDFAASGSGPPRQITVHAVQPNPNYITRLVLLLDQLAGIAVVIAAAWLVWTRPGPMSWGFFLYVNWFNPGQAYAYYAILQLWPAALLVQSFAGAVAQGVGFAGLILFVLRVPNDTIEPEWRRVERALPWLALVLALLLLASSGSLFGYPTETITRVGILAGFPVAIAAVAILLLRRGTQTPEDYQRMRWVIWGCLIGLPAFLIAELATTTTIFETRWGDFTPREDVIGLLYLINGALCLFVFEALRRRRVVSVMIPLRRVTILGLALSVPVLLLHHAVEHVQEYLPAWAWLMIGAVAIFLITRLHEGAVHFADRYFNRALDAVERELGAALLKAGELAEIDRLLASEPFRRLKLTSAASFRRDGSRFRRGPHARGWDGGTASLEAEDELLEAVEPGRPFGLADAERDDLPPGLARPVLAVPASSPLRCYALSLYGPHESGTDLDHYERAMLARLAARAAAMYAELEAGELRAEIARLERELDAVKPAPASPEPDPSRRVSGPPQGKG